MLYQLIFSHALLHPVTTFKTLEIADQCCR